MKEVINKIKNIDNIIINFIEKHFDYILYIVISLLAIYIRIKSFSFESTDYNNFLNPWITFFKNNNGLFALKNYSSDYNAPYMIILALLSYIKENSLTLIKSISSLFDFILAISSTYLFNILTKNKNKTKTIFIYSLFLFLPTIFLNSSMWGQCDSIYASFIILSLIFLIKEKYAKSFILLGVSFSFKLQFIFILPLYIILYFSKKKFSIFNFLLIPIIDIVMCLPALVAGRSFKKILLCYYDQTKEYNNRLVLNYPNIYQLINNKNVEYFSKIGIILVLVICFITLMYIIYKKVNWNNEKIITLGIWFIIIVTYFLPYMHDRYLYVAEVLSLIYILSYKKNYYIFGILELNGIIVYLNYLNNLNFGYMDILSIIYLIFICKFTKYVYELLIEKKKVLIE